MLLALLLLGAPSIDVFVKADLETAGTKGLVVYGTVRRTSSGTAVVLDDGTELPISTDGPPPEFLPLVGKYIHVGGSMANGRLTGWGKPTAASRDLNRLNGKHVELQGVAQDAKGGAVLLVDDHPLYLLKLAAWPEATRGKGVTVKGTLKSMKLIASPERNAKGELSQGAEGNQWVLEDPTY